jgi:hypothetical protein
LKPRAFVFLATILVAGRASADPTGTMPTTIGNDPNAPPVIDPTPPLGILPTATDALVDPRMVRSWGAAPSRWFLSTTADVGFVYARPRLSAGYGKPFTKWFGVDINPVAAGSGLGAYGGLRLEIPFLDIRAGVRYYRAFNRTYLDPHDHYDRIQLEVEGGTVSQVITYETEADSSIPIGPGNLVLRGSASYLTNVPNGKYVFEETLRIIANPPLVWRVRGGYVLRLGDYQQHSIGMVVDALDVPNRDDSKTIRVGPILRWVLSRRVEVRGSFVLTVYSPDRIGLVGSDFTELGVRYRWATE